MGTTTRDRQTTSAAVEIRLFGPLDLRASGVPLPPLRSKRGYWMLALLGLRADREVPRSYLAGTLWPDSTDEQALGNLRRTLADLRVALEAIGAGDLLDAPSARSLRLRTDGAVPVLLDIAEFDRAADRTDDEAETERAISLYRGPLLEGCLEEWALLERERREQEFLSALERAAAWAAGRGDHARAADLLRRAVGRDPLRETAQRTLMTALAAQGDFAAATQAFRDLRLRLRDALNAEPDPETAALYRRLKEEARRRAEAGPPPVVPKPAPPLPSTVQTPHNLRRPLTGLVGRSCEMAQIVESLSDDAGPPMVTLAGTGGVGKTRLAVEAGWTLVREGGDVFPDGVWFVDLAPVSDPARVAAAVAAVAGVRESGQEAGGDDLGRLCGALASRRLLLLLDNCEHLPDACAHVAAEILSASPGVRILATSRQVLGVPGERVLRVAPLIAEDPDSEAVRLFLARARAVAPNFAAAPESPRARAVAEVCRRLDGVPLAIELAAARVRSLSVEDIAARLGDRFWLVGGAAAGAGLAPRQRTLEALIGWSYDLLTEPERTLLRRVVAFAGGWTLDAAEEVCGEDGIDRYEVADLLASLVDKSLVVFEDAEGEGNSAPARYRLLETIREYGRARSPEGDAEFSATLDRHLAYYHYLARRADAAMGHDAPGGPAEAARWDSAFAPEWENVRAAWARACALGDPERTLALPTYAVRSLRSRGRMVEARAWLEEALRRERGMASAPTRGRALSEAAYFAMLAGDYDAAQGYNERALVLHRELDAPAAVAATLGNLAGLASLRGEHRHAADVLAECGRVYRDLNRPSSLANLLHLRSHALLRIPDWTAARADIEEALSICRALGDAPKLPLMRNTLAVILLGLGDTEAARRAAADSLYGAEAVGDKLAVATACVTLSNIAQKVGSADVGWADVPALLCRALHLLQELGRRYETATVFEEAARHLSAAGDAPQVRNAARLLGAASRIRSSLGVPDGADVLITRGALRTALPDFESLTAAGAALPEEAAVAFALVALGDAPAPATTFATAPTGALAGVA